MFIDFKNTFSSDILEQVYDRLRFPGDEAGEENKDKPVRYYRELKRELTSAYRIKDFDTYLNGLPLLENAGDNPFATAPVYEEEKIDEFLKHPAVEAEGRLYDFIWDDDHYREDIDSFFILFKSFPDYGLYFLYLFNLKHNLIEEIIPDLQQENKKGEKGRFAEYLKKKASLILHERRNIFLYGTGGAAALFICAFLIVIYSQIFSPRTMGEDEIQLFVSSKAAPGEYLKNRSTLSPADVLSLSLVLPDKGDFKEGIIFSLDEKGRAIIYEILKGKIINQAVREKKPFSSRDGRMNNIKVNEAGAYIYFAAFFSEEKLDSDIIPQVNNFLDKHNPPKLEDIRAFFEKRPGLKGDCLFFYIK